MSFRQARWCCRSQAPRRIRSRLRSCLPNSGPNQPNGRFTGIFSLLWSALSDVPDGRKSLGDTRNSASARRIPVTEPTPDSRGPSRVPAKPHGAPSMHRLAGLFAAFVILCGSAYSPTAAEDKTLTVFAAASMKNALDDIDLAFAAKTGVKVN